MMTIRHVLAKKTPNRCHVGAHALSVHTSQTKQSSSTLYSRTIQSVNMLHRCTQLTLILVAVLIDIAPACSTSLTAMTKKTWTAAGCSGTDTLIADSITIFDTTCMENAKDGVTYYEKSTCTANTATCTNGYTRTKYTDSACTVESTSSEISSDAETTGACTQSGTEYTQYGCSTTSATLGAVKWTKHSAAGCTDSTLTRSGYWAINFCAVDNSDGAYEKSEKRNIVDGKLSFDKWPASLSSKDCSATVTPEGAWEWLGY